jgi:transcriptional regulator with GAF, ATPase, and Fis domain
MERPRSAAAGNGPWKVLRQDWESLKQPPEMGGWLLCSRSGSSPWSGAWAPFYAGTYLADQVEGPPLLDRMIATGTTGQLPRFHGLVVRPSEPDWLMLLFWKVDYEIEGEAWEREKQKLLGYLYTSLALPNDVKVNLSAFERDRVMARNLAQTPLGQLLAEQDCMLKQLTATMLHRRANRPKLLGQNRGACQQSRPAPCPWRIAHESPQALRTDKLIDIPPWRGYDGMPIDGALFHREKAPIRLLVDTPAALRECVGTGRLPAAVVVRAADLGLFGENSELFKNRHQKDGRKALSAVLLRQGERIPFIDTNLTSDGRLKQSIDTLLKNAEEAGEAGIYVLGVSGEVFNQVWGDALEEDETLRHSSFDKTLSSLLTPLAGESQLSRRFWGDSEAFHVVRQLVLRAAKISDPVLIMGETGTGKGVVARAIHELGRPDKPFVEVNCAAIPSELFESELFGYMAGAFTGAHKTGKAGQWELARDGTLFLDEVGDLRLDHQAKILGTLQEGFIRRLGAVNNVAVTARVIAATNRNLWGMVQSGEFREDLYYRLRQFVILTPELRDDVRNLELIAQQLWQEITKSNVRLPKEILEDLCRHRWPGNVRELRSVLSSLNNFFGTKELRREHLNAVFQHFGLVAGYGRRNDAANEPALLKVECLRCIRRADDTLHACEQELKPLADGLPLGEAGRSSLARLRIEMQVLMRNRLYFGSQEAYESFARAEENLGHLMGMPAKDARGLARFWRSTMAPAIRHAVERLFGELGKLRQ